MENYFNSVREIYHNYSRLRDELSSLEKQANELSTLQIKISKELEDTRKAEKILINKIEESLGRALTQDDLIQIIKSDEEQNFLFTTDNHNTMVS